MKTLSAMILLAAMLSGCAGFDTVKIAVAQEGAKAADEARATAEWTLCDAITVGAWRRAYAGDAKKAGGWQALCAQPDAVPAAQ